MNKKRIILIISIIIVYSLVFKAWNLLIYTDNKSLSDFVSHVIKSYESPEIITIEKKEAKNYVEFDSIKIENKFQKFDKIETDPNKLQYIKYKDDNLDKYVSITKSNSFGSSFIYGFKNYSKQDGDSEYEDITLYEPDETYEYLKENNVTSDTKLFEFLLKNYDNQNKLFTKKSKMKENYYIKEYIANVIPRIKKLNIFKGLNGYMFETINDGFEVYVGNYSITLMGFTKEEALELVRTIKINEK